MSVRQHGVTVEYEVERPGKLVDQTHIISAIGEQLDLLESLFNWAILAAIATVWAGLQRGSSIEIFGHSFDRRWAFLVAATAYFFVLAAATILFLRIGDLLGLLGPEHLIEGLTVLFTHHWLLNPFTHFGDGRYARFQSATTEGTLIVVWWTLNASFHTLTDKKRGRATLVVLFVFIAVGIATFISIERVHLIAIARAQECHMAIAADLMQAASDRSNVNLLALFLGGAVFLVVDSFHSILIRGWRPTKPGSVA
jgi:uncharacterized membrane protein YwzB